MSKEPKAEGKKESKKMTPKQKALVALMPVVESGKMTLQAAMLEAGYSKSTAHQQSSVLGQIRTNSKMQDALEKAGFTEEYLAAGIVEGTMAVDGQLKVITKHEDGEEEVEFVGAPDHTSRVRYYKLGAELKDAFPAKKQLNADVGVEQMLDEAENESDYAEFNTQEKGK